MVAYREGVVFTTCVRVSTGENPTLKNNRKEIHVVASLLKQYLRELPEPLIPYDFFEVFLTAARCEWNIKANLVPRLFHLTAPAPAVRWKSLGTRLH